MNVLFTHSYFYKLDPKQWRFRQPYPPLGTILAAAVVRQLGHRVELFDTNLKTEPTDIVGVLTHSKPDVVVIYDDGFNYLTKMCLTVMREAAFVLANASHNTGCKVIVSSSDAADHYEKYLSHGVDYVIRGEGEETLKELIVSLANSDVPDRISGLAFLRDGKVCHTPGRAIMKDLDQLPLPAWDLVDVEQYRKIWMDSHGYFSINLATTRGCPFKCNWCAKPIYGNRYTSRSPAHVIKEIEYLQKVCSPDHFWMSDDIFGLKPGWVKQFNLLAKERNLVFRYKIQSRVDLLLEADTVSALADSGVETVWVGAESGSQKILYAMDKGTTVGQIYEATRGLKERGIRVGFFLQFGYPGENRDDIDATIKMVLDLMPDEVGISISYPLPGTPFYENVKSQLREKQNWTDSDDLSTMFTGTYTSDFYKELHRYVHVLYRKRKGYHALRKLFRAPFGLSRKELKSGLATFYYLPESMVKRLKLRRLEQSVKKLDVLIKMKN